MKIGVVAASSRYDIETARKAKARVAELLPDGSVQLEIHPGAFGKWGHFAGEDQARADAFLQIANDPRYDALWFARGGYGATRRRWSQP